MYFALLVCLATGVVATYDYTTDPNLYYDTWWGPDDADKDDTSITPFTIEWPEEDINDLVYRLKNRRSFVPSLDGVAYNYGVNTNTIGHWLDYWANEYNFTERLEYLNMYPQYKTSIRGLKMHFIHIKPEVPEGKYSMPLMILHGFPGSVREFFETAKYLTAVDDSRDFIPELIIPSLPGFGFSDHTNRVGLGGAEMAFILKELMSRLGHEKFYIQGGDWGALICQNMATFFPDDILGHHSNMGVSLADEALSMLTIGSVYPAALMPTDLISRLYPLKDLIQNTLRKTGYLHMQATEPDTLGIGMSDSPSAMTAWIFQQISTCSRKANINETMGGLDLYTEDELIDNLMIYWMNNKLPTAFRLYAESFNKRNVESGYYKVATTVPTIVVQAKDEIYYMPPAMLNTKFTNLVGVDVLYDYGHFLAWEQPKLFAELVLSALQRIIDFRAENNM